MIFTGDGSLARHEFGIIDSFEENKWYDTYEPDKYNCISVDDYFIEEIIARYYKELTAIKTYFVISTQIGKGLDEAGVTIIPPEFLGQFRDLIIKANSHLKSNELQILIKIISEAIGENKHLIHFGI